MTTDKTLNDLRKKINSLDSKLVKTLEKRQLLTNKIHKHKKNLKLKTKDPKREKEIISLAKKHCKHTKPILIEKIYKEIFKQYKND